MSKLLMGVLLAILIFYPVNAQTQTDQTQDGLRFVSVEDLNDILPQTGRHYQLAPDGKTLLIMDNDFYCVYQFDTSENNCAQLERSIGHLLYNAPRWSPDGRFVAMTENFAQLFFSPKIWLLDVQTGNLTQRTPQDSSLQIEPVWSPEGDLYFFFYEPVDEDTPEYTVSLVRIPQAELLTNAEPEFVVSLEQMQYQETTSFPVIDDDRNNRVALSPDGTMLAFMTSYLPFSPSPNSYEGIWLVDLTNGELRQLVDIPTIRQRGFSEAVRQVSPINLLWSADSTAVVIVSTDMSQMVVPAVALVADVATGDAVPIVDFSELSESQYFEPGLDGFAPMFDSSLIGLTLPVHDVYLMYNRLDDVAGFSLHSIFSGDEPPVRWILDNANSYSIRGMNLSAGTSDGITRVIFDSYLLTLAYDAP